MNDNEYGKRLVEEMILEQLLVSFPAITGRKSTDDAQGEFEKKESSPDFVIGIDGQAFGIELTEICDVEDASEYLEEASRLAWKKHRSYEKRGLFLNPIILIFHSVAVPLFDV